MSRLIHPRAYIEKGARIGAGTRVWQYCVVQKGARIGKDCNIGAHCYIESGSRIGDSVTVKNDVAVWEGVDLSSSVFVGPNAVFTNDLYPRSRRMPEARIRYSKGKDFVMKTQVGYGATIGAGALVLAGVSIGRFATLGMGAVVIGSVPDHAVVVGNPARRIGWSCECGLPVKLRDASRARCRLCGKVFRLRNGRLGRIA